MPRPPASCSARVVASRPTSAAYALAWFTASMVAALSVPSMRTRAASCTSRRAARSAVPTWATVRCTSGWWDIGSVEGLSVFVFAYSSM